MVLVGERGVVVSAYDDLDGPRTCFEGKIGEEAKYPASSSGYRRLDEVPRWADFGSPTTYSFPSGLLEDIINEFEYDVRKKSDRLLRLRNGRGCMVGRKRDFGSLVNERARKTGPRLVAGFSVDVSRARLVMLLWYVCWTWPIRNVPSSAKNSALVGRG